MKEDAELDLDFDSSLETAEDILREDIETIDNMQNEGDQSTFLCSLDIIKSHIYNTIERERKLLINIKTLKDHYFVSEIKKIRCQKLYTQTPHQKQNSNLYGIFTSQELNILLQEHTSIAPNAKLNKSRTKEGIIYPISYNLVSIPSRSYDIIHIPYYFSENKEEEFNAEKVGLIADNYTDKGSYKQNNSKDQITSMHFLEESNFPVHTIASNANHQGDYEKVEEGLKEEGMAENKEDNGLLEEQDAIIDSEQNTWKDKMYGSSKRQTQLPNDYMDRIMCKPKKTLQNALYSPQDKAQSVLASQEKGFKMPHNQDAINREAYDKIDSRAESLVYSAQPYLHFSIDDNLLNNDELVEFSNIVI
jgi:hypothetical protein